MRRGMQEVPGMEVPLVGVAGVFQNQQRNVEERRMVVEKQRERPGVCGLGHGPLDDGRADGPCYRGCSSRLSVREAYAGNGIVKGTLSPILQRNAAPSGLSPLLLEGSGPIPTLRAEAEGVPHYYFPFHGVQCGSHAAGIEQRERIDLLGQLRSLSIEKDMEVAAAGTIGNSPADPCGIWSQRVNGESSEGAFHNRHSQLLQTPVMLSDQERSASLMPQTHCYLTSNWLRPCRWQQDSPSSRSNGRYSESVNLFNEQSREDFGLDSNRYQTAKQVDESLFSHGRTDGIKEFMGSEKNRTYSVEHFDESTRPILPPTMVPSSLSAISMQPHRSELSSNGHSLLSLSPVASPQRISAITCEDSFIIQGKLRYLTGKKGCGLQRERKAPHRDGRLSRVEPHYLPSVMPKYQSLSDIQGFVNLVARDQQGCRFLQHKFDEGTRQEREIIFCEIIDHIAELMVNPFGNYLVQKVLDVCTEDQRLEIILVLTKNPTDLVRISLNMHGTRAVQRLIETLKNKKQIALVISALQPGFLSLIRDPNGNHVIQRCLQYFSSEDSKFIFEAAARHCVDIATHRHGCCVLQRCIAHSTGQHQAKLLAEVSRNGLMLAQDAYGNYAVQYVLDMRDLAAVNGLKSSFEGSYVELSTQKFSSNVVEKCLSVFDEPSRRQILSELLSVPFFDHLLQDPYANYVIQSALLTSKGQARNSLVEAIRAHEGVLRTSPYCKRIFNLLKK